MDCWFCNFCWHRCDMQIAHIRFARKKDLKTMNSAGNFLFAAFMFVQMRNAACQLMNDLLIRYSRCVLSPVVALWKWVSASWGSRFNGRNTKSKSVSMCVFFILHLYKIEFDNSGKDCAPYLLCFGSYCSSSHFDPLVSLRSALQVCCSIFWIVDFTTSGLFTPGWFHACFGSGCSHIICCCSLWCEGWLFHRNICLRLFCAAAAFEASASCRAPTECRRQASQRLSS